MFDAYHAGEIAVQERIGEREVAVRRASIVGERLAPGARGFLDQQGVAAVAAEAPDGSVWVSFWCGAPGFLRSDESGEYVGFTAALDLTAPGDPVRDIVRAGSPLGMVVIDLSTRRRLRINGVVNRAAAAGFVLEVRETLGNCPKYIQRRKRADEPADSAADGATNGHVLDDERRRFVARCDTLFVGSIHAERGLDASHRGGAPGFVQVMDDVTLRIPDYEGNSMYQTLGNFEVDSRAALALIDFERRRVLCLTGNASSTFGSEDPRHPTGGTGRYWSFTVHRWIELPLPPTVTWTLVDRSPFNPPAAA
jgi:predicted pyridoxine 5'-phosphate oxidase superfamily flavin-nucleotide-binding protein